MTFGGKYYLLETEDEKSLARKAEDITSTTPSSNKEVSIMSRSNALIKSSGRIINLGCSIFIAKKATENLLSIKVK